MKFDYKASICDPVCNQFLETFLPQSWKLMFSFQYLSLNYPSFSKYFQHLIIPTDYMHKRSIVQAQYNSEVDQWGSNIVSHSRTINCRSQVVYRFDTKHLYFLLCFCSEISATSLSFTCTLNSLCRSCQICSSKHQHSLLRSIKNRLSVKSLLF